MANIRETEAAPDHETEELEDRSSEEEGSEDETPQPKTLSLNSHSQKIPSSDEEDVDSDSYAPVKKSDPNTKSAANESSKPTPGSSVRKPRFKTSPAKPGAKRPAEKEVCAKVKKKSNKNAVSAMKGGRNVENMEPSATVVVSDDPKKQLFQRIWSVEDEIVILKGMIDYSAKNKADPVADFNAFLSSIKRSLHIEVTKTQLQNKVRKLKNKFLVNANKEKKSGKKELSQNHMTKSYMNYQKRSGEIQALTMKMVVLRK